LSDDAATLRLPQTIRARCTAIARWVGEGHSAHFTLDRPQLGGVASRVAKLTRERFPDRAKIPLHSRWRHFEAGGIDRKAELDARLASRTQVAAARARIDLALISVLLDAGAGPDWRYEEAESGRTFARSEGLAVASFRAFMAGCFSSDAGDPLRVDAPALLRLDARALAAQFQVSTANPLIGIDGRAALLRALGEALRARPVLFTSTGQPGHLFDALTHHRHAPLLNHHHVQPGVRHNQVSAARIFGCLLEALSEIWPSGQRDGDGVALGDVWPHRAVGRVPLHKLSQWLTYSLVEPFEWAGVHVSGLDELTGLPEYRNGGLLLDAGVIVPRDAGFATRTYTPGDEWVIEWRALTVALLDELAPLVRSALGAPELPLACLLEGGTWLAGRQIAAERRPGAAPPVRIDSDGTVF